MLNQIGATYLEEGLGTPAGCNVLRPALARYTGVFHDMGKKGKRRFKVAGRWAKEMIE